MTALTTDVRHTIAIIGGGLAGASLALLLVQQLPTHRALLLEQHALPCDASLPVLPSFDARSTALSYSTRDTLHHLGVWDALQALSAPIVSVHVSEQHRPTGLLMQAAELALPALGYVLENRHLGHVLLHALRQHPRIHCVDNTHIQQLHFTADAVHLHTDHTAYAAALAVIADGSHSALRQRLGIACDETPYHQSAVIANVETEKPHNGMAYERFTRTGPVALLPLPAIGTRHRAALIWTVPQEEVHTVLSLSDTDFLLRVQERFGDRCGRLLAMGERHSYPLVLRQAREQVRSRMVLLGNAAHSLHPVAGQGFNLILRDCVALTDTLVAANQQGQHAGELSVLQRYLQQQRWDQQKTIRASDALPRLFGTTALPHTVLRTAVLLGLDFLPGLRPRFAREATGLPS